MFDNGVSIKEQLLELLPNFNLVSSENVYLYEFFNQSWALLTCFLQLTERQYKFEIGNLDDIASSLSEYSGVKIIKKCSSMIAAIKYFKVRNLVEDQMLIGQVLLCADRVAFIDVYYKRGILLKELTMDMDISEMGAFGLSQSSDLVAVFDKLILDGDRINAVDLGSGNGLAACLISLKVKSVTGVEINRTLYLESIKCADDLAISNKVESKKIKLVCEDFFNTDFSIYDLIYLYWPYDDRNKENFEEDTRKRLEKKISDEAKKDTIVICFIPGMEIKNLFPLFKQIPIDIENLSTQVHVYKF